MEGNLSEIEIRRKRVRRVKALLRPLPRRTNLHKYPVIKWFANIARKRAYIWSFKYANVISALYLGWIIALIPIYGGQMVVVFILSLVFRSNCLIAMALQWVTNPFTIAPIMLGQYLLGDYILGLFTGSKTAIGKNLMETMSSDGFWAMVRSVADKDVFINLVSGTLFGGLILALLCAFISHMLYLIFRKRFETRRPERLPIK